VRAWFSPGEHELPTDLRAALDENLVVQQRIYRASGGTSHAAELSREVRRVVQAGRRDVVRGRLLLAALTPKTCCPEAAEE